MGSSLIIILFCDNAQPHVARMALQKLTELEHKILLQPPYSSDLLPIDNYFFKHLDTSLSPKNIPFQRRSKNCI